MSSPSAAWSLHELSTLDILSSQQASCEEKSCPSCLSWPVNSFPINATWLDNSSLTSESWPDHSFATSTSWTDNSSPHNTSRLDISSWQSCIVPSISCNWKKPHFFIENKNIYPKPSSPSWDIILTFSESPGHMETNMIFGYVSTNKDQFIYWKS